MYEAVRDDRQRYGFHRDVNRFKNRTDESAPCHGPSQAPGAALWFYGFVVHLTCTVYSAVYSVYRSCTGELRCPLQVERRAAQR